MPRVLTDQQRSMLLKLVAALRSGEYKQASGALVRFRFEHADVGPANMVTGYCCLGVAGKIAGYTEEQMNLMRYEGWSLDGKTSSTAGSVLDLAACAVYGFNNEDQRTLAGWNDSGMPFDQVADKIIERFDLRH